MSKDTVILDTPLVEGEILLLIFCSKFNNFDNMSKRIQKKKSYKFPFLFQFMTLITG